jgi:hypothetical protein
MFRLLALTVLASMVTVFGVHADGIGLEGSWQIGAYRLAVKNVAPPKDYFEKSVLTVEQNGKTIYTQKNAVFWLNPAGFFEHSGEMSYEESLKPNRIGADVLRLGAPTVVVWGFSLGAHCCFDLTILTFGPTFRAMPTLHLYDEESVDFRAAPARTALVMSASDLTFAYWRAPFADSSAPSVTLSYSEAAGRYKADPELMRTPPPNPAKLKDDETVAKATFQNSQDGTHDVPREVTQPVLDLVYGGHLDDARHFLEAAWVGSADAREDYWRELTECELRRSQFWPAVAKMNGLPPEKPARRCGGPRGWQLVTPQSQPFSEPGPQ